MYNFLKIFYDNIIKFFDVGTLAFYPKLARRPGNQGIIRFVVLYDVILFIATLIMLGLLFISGKAESVLTTKSLTIASLVFLLTWILIINLKMSSFMDAQGKTIINEVVSIITRIMLTTGLIVLFTYHRLNLITFLILQNAIFLVALFFLLIIAFKSFPLGEKSSSIKDTAYEFKDFSLPLFLSSTITIVTILGERWLLQIFGGIAAQGYYSLGINLSAICMLLTGSMAPLLTREYAIAYEKNDKTKLIHLYSKFIPLFYVITAVIACFLAVHGDWLAPLIGGVDFHEAALPVTLIGLSTIHQTYGQLSGELMSATDRTRELGGIAIFIAILGLPFTYFLLAPQQYWGLDLGATGLAIKLLIVQITSVNIQLWFNTRYLNIGITYYITHQVLVLILFPFVAFIGKFTVGYMLYPGIIALIASGGLYLSLVFTILLLFPGLIAMDRVEFLNHITRPSRFFKS
jgi:O-antigen/teichoic acid export membrane protein